MSQSLDVAQDQNRAELAERVPRIDAQVLPTIPAERPVTHTELASIATSPAAEAKPFGLTELLAYRDDLFRRAMFLTRDASRADDLVQDTFERAFRRVDRLPADSALRAWLYVIMSHRFVDLTREQRRVGPMPREEASYADENDDPPWWARISPEQLKAGVECLRPEIRQTFEMREHLRLSYNEIASRLGVPVATVGTRLSRARFQLRQILSDGLADDNEGA
jgi:RNA polymerase sigma-70 factor (ECF subfamily)